MTFSAEAGAKGYQCGIESSVLVCEKFLRNGSKWKNSDLPTLKFNFGGKEYAINTDLLIAQCQNFNDEHGPSRMCSLKVRSLDLAFRVLGMPFLQNHYVIFDREIAFESQILA